MAELERPQNPDDEISKLHHMSTTAGMGSGDYVEINSLAIASVVLALLSFWGIAFLPFLALGALGLTAGVVSLVKIKRSNGTQGGRLIAGLGIFLSLAIAGGEGTRQMLNSAKHNRDKQAISSLAGQLGEYVAKKDLVKARDLFNDDFKKQVSQEKFNEAFAGFFNVGDIGAFVTFETDGPFNFDESGDGGLIGSTNLKCRFEKKTYNYTTLIAVQDEKGNWSLYNLAYVFASVPKK